MIFRCRAIAEDVWSWQAGAGMLGKEGKGLCPLTPSKASL